MEMKNSVNLLFKTDEELVSRITQNDPIAIEYLFYKKCSQMFAYIVKEIYANTISKDELISELYIYLQKDNWYKLRQFDYKSKLTTWLSVVSVRFFLKKRRELIDSQFKKDSIDDMVFMPNKERYDKFMDNIDLYEAINRLGNKRERYVLLSSYIEGKEDEEIAQSLSVQISNVYNIKSRARKKMYNLMKEDRYVN